MAKEEQNATQDATPTPAQPPAATQTNITITLPDEWTLGHYQAYVNGRMAYRKTLPEDQRDSAAVLAMDYFGGRELIAKGFVHVGGDEQIVAKLKAYLAESDILKVPNSVVGLILSKISYPLDASFNTPFLG